MSGHQCGALCEANVFTHRGALSCVLEPGHEGSHKGRGGIRFVIREAEGGAE